MPGWTASTMQCVGRRRTRSPNSPKSDRIRDDTTASPTVEHEAVLDADDPTDRLQPWLPASQIRLLRTPVRMLRVGPGGMRPAEDRAEGPAAGTGVSCQTEGGSPVWGPTMFRVGGCEGLLEHVL
jgi:hypothetical protein